MTQHNRLDFITALGEEFCTILGPVVAVEISPQDGYELFAKVLGNDFGPDVLRNLPNSKVGELRAFGCTWLECADITDDHLRSVIGRTLSRL
jgi:hypothetical protein